MTFPEDMEDDEDGVISITLPNGETVKMGVKGEDGTSIVDAFVNRKGLKKYIEDVAEGHLIVETDEGEFIDTGKVTGENGENGKDGKDGKDYILTNRDKEEIAREITVPIVEKVIERTEVIKEQPIITNEIKEVAKYEDGEQIVKKINNLELDEDKKIDAKNIKNLPESTTIIRNVASGIDIRKDGVNKTTDVKSINFTGSVDVTDNNGDVTVNVTGGGGGGSSTRGSITGDILNQTDLMTELNDKISASAVYTKFETDTLLDGKVTSVVAGTGIVVDSTDTANPIVSVDPNLLTSSITFYSTTASSDISGYTKLVTSIEDPDYDEPAQNVPTGAITGTDQLVGELATAPGLFVGNPGIITITTIGEIRKTSGGSSNAQFYFKVFHRDGVGTETEIAVSNPTAPITNTVYGQFNTSALLNNGAFDITDMVVIKYYATKIGGGSDPEYDFSFGGDNPVRTLFPVPMSVLPTTQSYVVVTSNQTIDTNTVYGVNATSGDITLTLNNGTLVGQTLTVKKLDSSDNSVFVNTNSLIDGETSIEISMEGESYDFYWTGSTFNIK